jgi:3-oxoacyl-[acyl-carrier-protein] synthase-1
MPNEIYVTGIGVISAIGNNVEQNFSSLITKNSGLGSIDILQTIHKNEFKAGEIKLTNNQLLEHLDLPQKALEHFTRTSLLGLIAAKEAVMHSGININHSQFKTGLISATTVGGMDKTENCLSDTKELPSYLYTHPCGNSTNTLCTYLGITGYRTTLSTACSSGINAIVHAISLIRYGMIDRAVVGGVDSLSKFTLNGFNSLMILDNDFCKPFDQNRNGLNLGEGAGFLVIESEQSMKERQKLPLCKISGYANANDAFHQTASSPNGDGAFAAMTGALAMSGLLPNKIDYINAHGTGTPNNDMSESIALERVFGKTPPKFSSTKAYTGHTLGASASIEAVFSILALQNNIVFPNLNFHTKIEEVSIVPQQDLFETKVDHVLSNSFGFGGNNSSIIFSKIL